MLHVIHENEPNPSLSTLYPSKSSADRTVLRLRLRMMILQTMNFILELELFTSLSSPHLKYSSSH